MASVGATCSRVANTCRMAWLWPMQLAEAAARAERDAQRSCWWGPGAGGVAHLQRGLAGEQGALHAEVSHQGAVGAVAVFEQRGRARSRAARSGGARPPSRRAAGDSRRRCRPGCAVCSMSTARPLSGPRVTVSRAHCKSRLSLPSGAWIKRVETVVMAACSPGRSRPASSAAAAEICWLADSSCSARIRLEDALRGGLAGASSRPGRAAPWRSWPPAWRACARQRTDRRGSSRPAVARPRARRPDRRRARWPSAPGRRAGRSRDRRRAAGPSSGPGPAWPGAASCGGLVGQRSWRRAGRQGGRLGARRGAQRGRRRRCALSWPGPDRPPRPRPRRRRRAHRRRAQRRTIGTSEVHGEIRPGAAPRPGSPARAGRPGAAPSPGARRRVKRERSGAGAGAGGGTLNGALARRRRRAAPSAARSRPARPSQGRSSTGRAGEAGSSRLVRRVTGSEAVGWRHEAIG